MKAAISLAVCLTCASAGAQMNAVDSGERLDRLHSEQRRQADNLREKMTGLPDSPRRQELERLLAEIEKRMEAEGASKRYVSPSTKLLPDMHAYREKLRLRLEDCGTRHFPKDRGGASIHGRNTLVFEVDRTGRLVEAEVAESSKNRALDAHAVKIVRASAPFGTMPALAVPGQATPHKSVVFVYRFDFSHDPSHPAPDLPEQDRCRWK